jgi:hypothetical protein
MALRVNGFSLQNKTLTSSVASIPQNTINWKRVAIVAAIGIGMIGTAYFLTRDFLMLYSLYREFPMLNNSDQYCNKVPRSKICPDLMNFLEKSCTKSGIDLSACEQWKISRMREYENTFDCISTTNCTSILNNIQRFVSSYETANTKPINPS